MLKVEILELLLKIVGGESDCSLGRSIERKKVTKGNFYVSVLDDELEGV